MKLILLLHIFTTLFMCGLCWFVQIVHYPLFKEIPLTGFSAYHKKNYVTGFITVPVMVVELLTAIWLVYSDYSQLLLVNLLLLAVIWGSTFLFQVPAHLQMDKTPTHAIINKLVRTNWIRTLAWTLRSILFGYLLLSAF